jgi:hypothetical protein
MKRILFLILAILLVFQFSVFASVKTHKDSFDNSSMTYSMVQDVDRFSSIIFSKMDNNQIYLTFTIMDTDWWFFTEDYIEVKFDDGSDIYKIPVKTTSSNIVDHNILCTSTDMYVPELLVEKIKSAKDVTFRISFKNASDDVFKVPSKVLKEWKQVLEVPDKTVSR